MKAGCLGWKSEVTDWLVLSDLSTTTTKILVSQKDPLFIMLPVLIKFIINTWASRKWRGPRSSFKQGVKRGLLVHHVCVWLRRRGHVFTIGLAKNAVVLVALLQNKTTNIIILLKLIIYGTFCLLHWYYCEEMTLNKKKGFDISKTLPPGESSHS